MSISSCCTLFTKGGARQSIRLFRNEDVPVILGLVIDYSGSMRPKKATLRLPGAIRSPIGLSVGPKG
jgi:hypothetical protein